MLVRKLYANKCQHFVYNEICLFLVGVEMSILREGMVILEPFNYPDSLVSPRPQQNILLVHQSFQRRKSEILAKVTRKQAEFITPVYEYCTQQEDRHGIIPTEN